MRHRLDAGADRSKAIEPQQVEPCCAQGGHHAGAIAAVTVGILVELRVTDPVPALQAPALSHQPEQGFWGGAQAGEKQVSGLKGSAITAACGCQLHDPAGADPGFLDVLRSFFRPQDPGDVAPMADLVIGVLKSDLAFPLELALDLAMQRLLVGLDRQQEVGSLLLELPKNGFWVCNASAWISTPSRSRSPSNCLSTARSWFLPVA